MANLNILMSIGSILLLVLWFLNPGIIEGCKKLMSNVGARWLLLLFAIHLIWLISTSDFAYAFKDIRIKLPLLIFTLVLCGIDISSKQLRWIFISLAAGVGVASLSSYYNYFFADLPVLDHRSLVTGISHIRLSLMMVFAVAGALYHWRSSAFLLKMFWGFTIVNVFIFFNLIQSATGVGIVIILLVWTFFYHMNGRWNRQIKRLTLFSLVGIPVLAILGTYHYYQDYFVSDQEIDHLAVSTNYGHPYNHYPKAGFVENGEYVFNNISEIEMASAWNERSKIKIGYQPLQNGELIAALTRYLTSKNLKKDRDGVMALTDRDIQNIEKGYPSITYAESSGLILRYHTLLFGIHQYLVSGNASGISLMQRMVYWEAAAHLIGKNTWLGVGTGDVKQAFLQDYEDSHSRLEMQYRNRGHNQFLTFWVSFGIAGIFIFVGVFFVPVFLYEKSYLFSAFLLIAFMSCLTEDTLETQAGVTFFAFFYALFASREMVSKEN